MLLPYKSSAFSPLSVSKRLLAKGPVDPVGAFDECAMYVDPDNRSLGTQECVHGYEFHVEGKEWNVIAEWGLVCDRAFIGPLMTTVYFCGVMIGGLIFGSLSDRFGRKYMMLVCLYTQCVIGIGIHFVRRLIVFMGLRFIQGIFIQVGTTTISRNSAIYGHAAGGLHPSLLRISNGSSGVTHQGGVGVSSSHTRDIPALTFVMHMTSCV
jgi:hypothetical protein